MNRWLITGSFTYQDIDDIHLFEWIIVADNSSQAIKQAAHAALFQRGITQVNDDLIYWIKGVRCTPLPGQQMKLL